jgi:hypothetical protein
VAEPAPINVEALTFPEGFQRDEALMAEFGKVPGLTQESAQNLADLHQRAMSQASERYWNDRAAQWERESRAEIENLDAVVSTIQPLLHDETLTDPAFVELLDHYGLGNHPAVIRTLSRWARAIENR